jgi:hypothetical protein
MQLPFQGQVTIGKGAISFFGSKNEKVHLLEYLFCRIQKYIHGVGLVAVESVARSRLFQTAEVSGFVLVLGYFNDGAEEASWRSF